MARASMTLVVPLVVLLGGAARAEEAPLEALLRGVRTRAGGLEHAIAALGSDVAPALPALEGLLEEPSARETAAWALGQLGAPGLEVLRRAAVGRGSPAARSHAVLELAARGAGEVPLALAEAEPDDEVRRLAVVGLLHDPGRAAQVCLLRVLASDRAKAVREAAAHALAARGVRDPEVHAALLLALRGPAGDGAGGALLRLQPFPDGAWALLAELLGDPDPALRVRAARLLARSRGERGLATLREALSGDRRPAARAAAARGLRWLRANIPLEPLGRPLVDALVDPAPDVRIEAAGAVAELSRRLRPPVFLGAGALLQAMSRDPDPAVRAAATEALLHLAS